MTQVCTFHPEISYHVHASILASDKLELIFGVSQFVATILFLSLPPPANGGIEWGITFALGIGNSFSMPLCMNQSFVQWSYDFCLSTNNEVMITTIFWDYEYYHIFAFFFLPRLWSKTQKPSQAMNCLMLFELLLVSSNSWISQVTVKEFVANLYGLPSNLSGILLQMVVVATTTRLLQNMSPPRRASWMLMTL